MANPNPSLTPWLRQALIQSVGDRYGFQIRESDQNAFSEIILKRTQKLGLPFPERYYQLLEANTEAGQQEWETLIAEVTNTESFFFRDKGQFKLLREHIFPELIKKNSTHKILKICSAGCSTGEEPYSIAMLLRQMIPDIEAWNVSILGIDINSAALERAEAGLYRPWSFRGIDADVKQQFFKAMGENYQLNGQIQTMVNFQVVNLVNDSFSSLNYPIEDMDLILCRNVFIYFSDAAIKAVLTKFYNALHPWGYLLMGHAELHSQNLDQFQVRLFDESVAYQRAGGRHRQHLAAPSRSPSLPRRSPAPEVPGQDLAPSLADNDTKMQQVALGLLRQLPGDTRIARLGNLTAAELIRQLEQRSVTD